MDTVLTTVTLISLGMAAALAVVVARLVREERRRSDARVAALSALADASDSPAIAMVAPPRATAAPVAVRPAVPAPVPANAPAAGARIRPAAAVRAPARPRIANPIEELEIRRPAAVEVASVSGLFEPPDAASPWGRRLAVIGLIVAVAGGALFAYAQRAGRGDTVTVETTEQRPVAAAAAPLELASLRHTQQGATLTISGLVQNPKSGTPLTRLVATAVVFGSDGTLVASGKAPLDYTTLAAGDESPFVITVPLTGAVARYRIGFRSEDGTVVAHVDRRSDDAPRRAGL